MIRMKQTNRFLGALLGGAALVLSIGAGAVSAQETATFGEEPVDTSDVVLSLGTDIVVADRLPLDSLWEWANAAYSNGNYRQAADWYEALLARGVHGVKLYYNLGNSWFKQGRMGKAILNYNRALLLDPTDEDTEYNLSLAQARIVDKIDTVPEFFLKGWLRRLGLTLGSNAWAVLGLVFLGAAFAGTILWLLSRTLVWRKVGFYGGIVAAGLCFLSVFYADFQRARLLHNREAVVMNLVAPVKSSPGTGGKDLFVLHEGTKVRMQEELDGWIEIVLSDGNRGWIASDAIEAVDPSVVCRGTQPVEGKE